MKTERERAEELLTRLFRLPIWDCDLVYHLCNDEMDTYRMHQFVALHLIEDALGESVEDSDLVQDLKGRIEDLEMQVLVVKG